MLDPYMMYTCGYWKKAKTLAEAQEAKIKLICEKMQLQKGMHVLDIGCGFGGFAKYATTKYGVKVTGISVSKEQNRYAKKLCQGLDAIFELKDYRDISGRYDAVVSIGMYEAVGAKNFRTFMEVVHSHLKDHGIFLLHTIGSNRSGIHFDPWLEKYIFPNGEIPAMSKTAQAIEDLFVMEDWHNFGADYEKTLFAWFANCEKNKKKIEKLYDVRFYRMWKYYLLCCAATFTLRNNQLWHIVLSKNGIPGGYTSIR